MGDAGGQEWGSVELGEGVYYVFVGGVVKGALEVNSEYDFVFVRGVCDKRLYFCEGV